VSVVSRAAFPQFVVVSMFAFRFRQTGTLGRGSGKANRAFCSRGFVSQCFFLIDKSLRVSLAVFCACTLFFYLPPVYIFVF